MSLSEGSRTTRQIDGKREMTELTCKTITALQEADLEDEIDMLQARVFARSKEDLFETAQMSANHWHWQFKPMVALVLYEIQEIANATALSIEDRRRQIGWILNATGF